MPTLKSFLINLALVLLFVPLAVAKTPRIIFEANNRIEAEYVPDKYKRLARTSVSLFMKSKLKENLDGSYTATGRTLKDTHGMCNDQKYVDQTSASYCSGCLISRTQILTAGHCVDKKRNPCSSIRMAFDHYSDDLKKENVYACKSVVTGAYDNKNVANAIRRRDYAIIELDRPVTGRAPAALRSKNKPAVNSTLIAIGSLQGTPQKASFGQVKSYNKDLLVTDLNAFEGDWGVCIFNDKGEIEGVHSGSGDLKSHVTFNTAKKCNEYNNEDSDSIHVHATTAEYMKTKVDTLLHSDVSQNKNRIPASAE